MEELLRGMGGGMAGSGGHGSGGMGMLGGMRAGGLFFERLLFVLRQSIMRIPYVTSL